MSTYAIDDTRGFQIACDLPADRAESMAKTAARRRGEPVWLYREDSCAPAAQVMPTGEVKEFWK